MMWRMEIRSMEDARRESERDPRPMLYGPASPNAPKAPQQDDEDAR